MLGNLSGCRSTQNFCALFGTRFKMPGSLVLSKALGYVSRLSYVNNNGVRLLYSVGLIADVHVDRASVFAIFSWRFVCHGITRVSGPACVFRWPCRAARSADRSRNQPGMFRPSAPDDLAGFGDGCWHFIRRKGVRHRNFAEPDPVAKPNG